MASPTSGAHRKTDFGPLLMYPRRATAQRQSASPPPTLAAFVELTSAITLDPWQRILCERLARYASDPGQRLLVHGPPQFGKSLIVSQRLPAWLLGCRPDCRIRLACYNVSHAERFTSVALELMRLPEYRKAFPGGDARVPAICPRAEWSTAARTAIRDGNPSMLALGLGSGFTGLASDIVIIDDPYKNAQEARSPAHNTYLWDWWTQVVTPRLNPSASVVVMFHRWWEGDFAGRLLDTQGWETMRFPAIADTADPARFGRDPTGRQPGELLSPRFSREYLDAKRLAMGTAYHALYDGVPTAAEGQVFRAQPPTQIIDAAPGCLAYCRRWDLADSRDGDYTVGVLMGKDAAGRYHVLDVVRGRWLTDERDAIITATARRDASFGQVLQVLPQDPGQAGVGQAKHFSRLLAGFRVRTERETGDKIVRADPFACQWNAGNIMVIRAPWNAEYLAEIMSFPSGRHDDQVDASSGAFANLANAGPGIVHSARPEHRAAAAAAPSSVFGGGASRWK